MKVLKNWDEIGESVNALLKAGLPLHTTPAKCWDFNNLREIFSDKRFGEKSSIADLGCGPSLNGCMTLELLRCMGFRNLTGVDLHIPAYTRLAASVRGYIKARSFTPYRMVRSDLTATKFGSASVDAVILLSVIEHGVDLERLFSELRRILKKGGVAYISTDYWEKPLGLKDNARAASGAANNKELPWTIFDKAGIERMLAIAEKNGLRPRGKKEVPPCEGKPVHWQGLDYTFISVVLERTGE